MNELTEPFGQSPSSATTVEGQALTEPFGHFSSADVFWPKRRGFAARHAGEKDRQAQSRPARREGAGSSDRARMTRLISETIDGDRKNKRESIAVRIAAQDSYARKADVARLVSPQALRNVFLFFTYGQ